MCGEHGWCGSVVERGCSKGERGTGKGGEGCWDQVLLASQDPNRGLATSLEVPTKDERFATRRNLSEPPLTSTYTQNSGFILFYHAPLWPAIQIISVNRCEKVDYSSQIHNLFHSMFFAWSLLQKWKWKSTSELKLRMVPSKCQGHKLRFSGGKIGSRKGFVKTKMYFSQRECV